MEKQSRKGKAKAETVVKGKEKTKEKKKEKSYMMVNVARLGSNFKKVLVEEGSTVKDALDKAGIKMQRGDSVAINNKEVKQTTPVFQGDRLFVLPATTGGPSDDRIIVVFLTGGL